MRQSTYIHHSKQVGEGRIGETVHLHWPQQTSWRRTRWWDSPLTLTTANKLEKDALVRQSTYIDHSKQVGEGRIGDTVHLHWPQQTSWRRTCWWDSPLTLTTANKLEKDALVRQSTYIDHSKQVGEGRVGETIHLHWPQQTSWRRTCWWDSPLTLTTANKLEKDVLVRQSTYIDHSKQVGEGRVGETVHLHWPQQTSWRRMCWWWAGRLLRWCSWRSSAPGPAGDRPDQRSCQLSGKRGLQLKPITSR